mgnify:CR=1 FL=1
MCPDGCGRDLPYPNLLNSEGLLATPPTLSASGGYGGRLAAEAAGMLSASGERPLQTLARSVLAPREQDE